MSANFFAENSDNSLNNYNNIDLDNSLPQMVDVDGIIEIHDPLISPTAIMAELKSDPAYQTDLPPLSYRDIDNAESRNIELLLDSARKSAAHYGILTPSAGLGSRFRHLFRRGARFLFRRHLYQTKEMADSFLSLLELSIVRQAQQEAEIRKIRGEFQRMQAEQERRERRESALTQNKLTQ